MKSEKKLVVYTPENNSGLKSFLEQDIIFVEFLNTTFLHNETNLNCDCILFLDGGKEPEYFKLKSLYKNVIGIPRFSKSTQILLLKKFNINYPESFFSNQEMFLSNKLTRVLRSYDNETLLVVKIDIGARGLGQMLLTKKDFILLSDSYSSELRVLKNHYKETCDEYKEFEPMSSGGYVEEDFDSKKIENLEKIKQAEEFNNKILNKFKDVKFSQNEFHSMLYESLIRRRGNDNGIIIQKYIPNRNEFRILWFYKNKPIIIKREIGVDNWQANACGHPDNKSYVIKDSSIDKLKPILKQIDELCLHLKAPFLSVDVYHDLDTNKFGIFEFQIEFGWTHTENLESSELSTKIVNSTKSLINDNL